MLNCPELIFMSSDLIPNFTFIYFSFFCAIAKEKFPTRTFELHAVNRSFKNEFVNGFELQISHVKLNVRSIVLIWIQNLLYWMKTTNEIINQAKDDNFLTANSV